MKHAPLEVRYWAKVAMPADPFDCWNWTGATRNGYGVIGLGGRKDGIGYAHRLSYLFQREFIRDGMDVCHACNNRLCVNPLHLYEGSRADNMDQASRSGRLKRQYKPWSKARRDAELKKRAA